MKNSLSYGTRWPTLGKVVVAFVVLNFLTSFNNLWPTPFIEPDARIGPEFIALWVLLLVLVARFGKVGSRTLASLTGLFLIIVIGRYADETAPALLGRQVNVYWDVPQLPRFLDVVSQSFVWWQIVLILASFALGLWLLVRVIRVCIATLATHAAPYALRSPPALLVTLFLIGSVVANVMRVEATWPYISRPVSPLLMRQVDLLLTAFVPSRLANVLPASPSLASDLRALDGAEVKVVFIESYGVTTYEQVEIAEVVDPVRAQYEQAANAAGRQVLSGFVRAATFGGASDLSHLSFLSGIDLSDPLRHDVLLTTDRDTMLDTFERAGYRTIGLYPAMSWDWPEQSFYDFDNYHDGPSLNYVGPGFGLWWLPDQFSMARIDEMYPPDPEGKPRFLFFPTITSHIPFRPTPPYQPDWSRVTSDDPFPADEAAAALADAPDWHDLLSGYASTIEYTFRWLAGYESLPRSRDSVLILLGDHQPAGSVTGPNVSWDVPVHIVTSNNLIAERLRRRGFSDGMNPRREILGHISALNQILLAVFDSRGTLDAAVTTANAGTRSAAVK